MQAATKPSILVPVAFAYSLPFLVVFCAAAAQLAPIPTESHALGSYSNKAIGFRYAPPGGMLDKTQISKSQIQQQAKALGTAHILGVLLAISSGPDSDTTNWGSVTIETYPRNAVSEPDDAKAAAQMNAWVAQSKDASALPKSIVISGQSFTVSVFGLQERTVKKGAVVWTTVRNGKLLSFAFVANTPDRLKGLTETMKSVQFF
ncbi:MAG TPA: hypothetical protein VIW68_08765 [Candidatus Sulfotelmatobacter sp.]